MAYLVLPLVPVLRLLLKLQKAKDDVAQARRLHQKGEDELAQLAPKINDQASRLEKNTQKLQLLRSDIREKFGEMESLNERMLSLHRCSTTARACVGVHG